MDRQLRVGKLFNFFVRLVGASRFTKRHSPIFGTFAVIALGFGFSLDTTHVFIAQTASDVRMAASYAAESAGAVALAEDLAPEASDRKVELKLTREQLNIAKFIAARYSIEVDDAKQYVVLAYNAAKQYRLDPHLVLAVMSIESSFDPDAQSHAGAQGLMQVLTRVHKEKFAPFGGVAAAYDPESNVKVGAQILKEYLVRNGSEAGALKSYVGAALMDSDSGYGFKVLSQKARIVAAAQGKPIPVNPMVNMPILAAAMPKPAALPSELVKIVEMPVPPSEESKAIEPVAVDKSADI
jgi:Transglycosylase SLT domain